MGLKSRAYTAGIERIFDLMTNPEMSKEHFCKRWEVSEESYYRYKRLIRDRLYMYKVTRL